MAKGYIYRVVPDVSDDAHLGYDECVIGGFAWFSRKKDAESFVRNAVTAWIANPPGFCDDEERDEYFAQDFRDWYSIEKLSMDEAMKELEGLDAADALTYYLDKSQQSA